MNTISTICTMLGFGASLTVLLMGHLSHQRSLKRSEDWDSR